MHNADEIAKLLQQEQWAEGTAWAYARTGGRCTYCYRDLIADRLGFACGEIDHLLPRNQYDALADNIDNLVLACRLCNSVKGAHDVLRDGENQNPTKALTEIRDTLIVRAREYIFEQRRTVHDPQWKIALRIICCG